MPSSKRQSNGFTTVEALLTIVVGALFLLSFYQLFIMVNIIFSSSRQKAVANELAYSYMQRYAGTGSTPSSWFACSTATGSSNTNDYTVNINAAGQTLLTGTLTNVSGLPGSVAYTVSAIAVYGCSGINSGTPIRVTSRISYGTAGKSAEYSTLVGY